MWEGHRSRLLCGACDFTDGPFESADRTILRIDSLTNVAEATFQQHSFRGSRVRKRVRSDKADLLATKSAIDQRLCHLTGVTFSLVVWINGISNFDGAVHRWTLEAAASYD